MKIQIPLTVSRSGSEWTVRLYITCDVVQWMHSHLRYWLLLTRSDIVSLIYGNQEVTTVSGLAGKLDVFYHVIVAVKCFFMSSIRKAGDLIACLSIRSDLQICKHA